MMQEIAQQRKQSLSARRAWIEILTDDVSTGGKIVALRKESVDRNCLGAKADSPTKESLSARRAWIEIRPSKRCAEIAKVALRKESVDRNAIPMGRMDHSPQSLSARRAWIEIIHRGPHHFYMGRRSPQGERG